jgi:UDP:flavonoid glycosyltransferase YjiC (YdhE family)
VWASSYLSYDDVLSRCVAVIHHGGAGVTYSTLRAGLPALVFPHDYDQPDFAARLIARGCALRIRDLDSAMTAHALEQALNGIPTAGQTLSPAAQTLSRAAQTLSPIGVMQAAIARADPYLAVADAVARVTGNG